MPMLTHFSDMHGAGMKLRICKATAAFVCAGILSTSAYAIRSQITAAEDAATTPIVVTGSRIMKTEREGLGVVKVPQAP